MMRTMKFIVAIFVFLVIYVIFQINFNQILLFKDGSTSSSIECLQKISKKAEIEKPR